MPLLSLIAAAESDAVSCRRTPVTVRPANALSRSKRRNVSHGCADASPSTWSWLAGLAAAHVLGLGGVARGLMHFAMTAGYAKIAWASGRASIAASGSGIAVAEQTPTGWQVCPAGQTGAAGSHGAPDGAFGP